MADERIDIRPWNNTCVGVLTLQYEVTAGHPALFPPSHIGDLLADAHLDSISPLLFSFKGSRDCLEFLSVKYSKMATIR